MATNPTNQASDVLLALLVEIGGLAVITTMAGISDSMANLMMVLIVGVWMLWMVKNGSKVTALNNSLNNVLKVG